MTASNILWRSVLAAAVLLAIGPVAGADEPTPRLGTFVGEFHLLDHQGKQTTLSQFADNKVVIVAFLGTECPLAKLYGARLVEIESAYKNKSVAVIGINSNRQDSLSELNAYAAIHKIDFPLLKDAGCKVADDFGAERTPQVFVLDQDRVIRYAGAIDDQYGIGFQKQQVSKHYLTDAIDCLLAGREVATPSTTAIGCVIGRETDVADAAANSTVTYTKHIAPILNSRCVECHRAGEVAPFSLASYNDVLGWEDTIVETVDGGRMPPWFADPQHGVFKNDARLTDDEKRLVREWVASGSPRGDAADLPPTPEFAEGWRMAEPDQVVRMDGKAFAVPAEGVVDYQYFVVDPQWDEDKYVVAAEARPGNRSVVHHILVYVVPPGTDPREDQPRTALVGYAPGAPPNELNPGHAIHVAAGSKLLFEMHYTPTGSPQEDLSYVGIAFTERERVEKFVRGEAVINHDFSIPPRADNHPVVADYVAKRDELLLRMTPHMHLRGKSFRFEAIFPDDRREVLLDVPRYDFNWQLTYQLATPLRLPKGTHIVCTAHFDNSPQNPANPNPDIAVDWGQQSWDEMMIGFFDVVDDDGSAQAEQ